MNLGSFTDEVTVWKKGAIDDFVKHSLSEIQRKPSRETMEACIEVNDHFDKTLYGEIEYVVELSYRHPSWDIFLQKKCIFMVDGNGPGQSSRRACLDSAKHAFLILIEDEYRKKEEEKEIESRMPTREQIKVTAKLYYDFDINTNQIINMIEYRDEHLGETFRCKYVVDRNEADEALMVRNGAYNQAFESLCQKLKEKYAERIKEEKNMPIKNFVMEQIQQPKHTMIKDITVYNDKVVKMDFTDETFTKAVCGEHDEFNLDTGITICLVKKMLGGQEDGTRCYNNLLRDLHGLMEDKEKAKIEEAEEKERQKQKRRNHELKRAKKKLMAKEAQIDIQRTAFTMALRECGLAKEDDLK